MKTNNLLQIAILRGNGVSRVHSVWPNMMAFDGRVGRQWHSTQQALRQSNNYAILGLIKTLFVNY